MRDIDKIISLASKMTSDVFRDRIHISLIVEKNEVLAVGTNNWKTHPKTIELGYAYPWLHSELDAFRKLKGYQGKMDLINLRFSKTGKLGMAKPCKYCLPWCEQVFNRIIYSNEQGTINIYGQAK